MADTKISALPASTVPLAGTEVLPIVQSSSTKQVSVANLTAGRDIAATSLTTAAIQATNSGGLALKNSSGTTQLSVGAGGGDNITLSVATNITPANAAVAISPTGTGTVAISPAGALTINPTAASTINNTSVGATTASTGRFTNVTLTTGSLIVASGQGVDFSATPGTGSSELFDDYEIGTHTTTANANTTLDNSYKAFKYTKVGNVVTVVGLLQITGSSGTDTLTFTLPFTAAADQTNGQNRSVGGCLPGNATTGTGGMVPFVQNNTAIMNLYKISLGVATNSTYAAATNADVINGSSINFNITYLST
jgi:hypothetical protein